LFSLGGIAALTVLIFCALSTKAGFWCHIIPFNRY